MAWCGTSLTRLCVLIGCWLLPLPLSYGSLVISYYSGKAMYVASDSLVTGEGGFHNYKSEKVFSFGKSQMVAITGEYGTQVNDKSTGKTIDLNLLSGLKARCEQLRRSTNSLRAKIEEIVKDLDSKTADYAQFCTRFGKTNSGIGVFFAAYDETNKKFLGLYSRMYGTNHPALTTAFDSSSTTNQTFLGVLGEDHFLGTLLASPQTLPPSAQSKTLRETITSLREGLPIPDDKLAPSLFEIFRLHKSFANVITSGEDKGLIDEPFVIYRIMSEGIEKL
jgi:hypothetical protein